MAVPPDRDPYSGAASGGQGNREQVKLQRPQMVRRELDVEASARGATHAGEGEAPFKHVDDAQGDACIAMGSPVVADGLAESDGGYQ